MPSAFTHALTNCGVPVLSWGIKGSHYKETVCVVMGILNVLSWRFQSIYNCQKHHLNINNYYIAIKYKN